MTDRTDPNAAGESAGAPSYYTTYWYFDFLPEDTQNLDEMILAVEAQLANLREMRAAGVELAKVVYEAGHDEFADYAFLFTTDRAVAERFDFDLDPIDGNDWEDYQDFC